MSVLDLARPELLHMKAYSSARMEASVGEVWLNANESAWTSFGTTEPYNRYPDPQPMALLDALASLYGVARERVLVGRGSDEAIDLLVRAFCRAGQDAIVIQPPTFGMYAVCAAIQAAAVIEVPLTPDFQVDADAVLAVCDASVKLVFLCNPNNPSGACVPRDTLVRLADGLRGRALLVVDEAYAEFAEAADASAIALLDRYEHVAVLRTLSKAWGLAGARIGTLLAAPAVIDLLRKIIPPYPLPSPCIDAAMRALSVDGQARVATQIAQVRNERTRLAVALQRLPGVREVLPSASNFLTVRLTDAGEVYRQLLAAGIVVRDVRRYPNLGDALRITIGTPMENDRVLRVLEGALA